MAIDDRNLTPGTVLTARYKQAVHVCTVEQDESGKLVYAVAEGQRFRSPSAAGSAVMGGIACNGWRFWSLATDQVNTVPPPAAAKFTVKGGRKRKAGLLSPLDGPQTVAAGMTRWWCAGCQQGFDHPAGESPAACPAGHTEQSPA